MMNIFQDLLAIFSSFEIIDVILYVAVVTLIVLVVSLIYVLKNENEEELAPIDGEDFMNKIKKMKNKKKLIYMQLLIQ